MILHIRQVQPFLVLHADVVGRSSLQRLLLILVVVPPPDETHEHDTDAPADYEGDFGGDVAGGVFGAEGLGACVVLVSFACWLISPLFSP